MSTQESPLTAAPAFPSSEVLNVLYRGRDLAPRQKSISPRRMESMKNNKLMGPDAIWGQYNNYRSNGSPVHGNQ